MTDSKTEQEKAQELRKQLDWELSLDSSELVSHGWYHGPLDRGTAESHLQHDGSFLVRDSATQPGHYVLSCRQGSHFLHFVINRVVIQPDTVYEHFQYQLEHEAYDTVPDLVTSYVGSGKPISLASGARIQIPSNRIVPLLSVLGLNRGAGHIAAKQYQTVSSWKSSNSALSDSTLRKTNSLCGHNVKLDNCSCYVTNNHKVSHTANEQHNVLWKGVQSAHIATKSISFGEQQALLCNTYNSDDFNFKKQRSLSLSPAEILSYQSKSASGDGVVSDKKIGKEEENKQEFWENQGSPPAKPARTQPAYQASGSDSGNGSGDSAQSLAPGDNLNADARASNQPKIGRMDVVHAEEMIMKAQLLEFKQLSVMNPNMFRTDLFATQDNKPLESDTLQSIKLLLRTSGPMILANHLTRVDLKFILEAKGTNNGNVLDNLTGLELCLLVHGEQMRMDIIERAECMKFLIVVTILTCQSDAERADVLNDWIQLAIETKTALGNLYGFSIIMQGLCTKQINNMENMWNILRQMHTHSAFTFESKLRPSFKNMNECIDSSPPNMTLPHLLPVVMLLKNPDAEKQCEEYGVNTADFGLSIVSAHLEAARKYSDQIPFFERNAKVALGATPAPVDDILLDLFTTEFHIKFLWGARGAMAPYNERHAKLSDILNTMAERYLTPPSVK